MTTVPVVVFALIRVMEVFTAPFYYLIAFVSNRKRIPAATNPILNTSASVLAEKIRARELTCHQVVSAFVERCKLVNPIVNAIIEERYQEALADAEKADQFLHETRMFVPQSRLQNEKPLLGIPVTIKECCSMKGMTFSMGVERYKNKKAAYNGDAVQLLIEAGAIPIAVTSTPAYSSWIETFNAIIGYTSNPYDSRKSCAGSSGGEEVADGLRFDKVIYSILIRHCERVEEQAALIASAASVIGLGSDAGGSIRIPAAFCGIYGHKPSNTMVSTGGHATFFSHRQLLDMLTVGPLCRYAADLQLAMNVLSGKRLQRWSTPNATKTNFRRIRVYHMREYEQQFFSVDATLKTKILQAIAHLETKYGCFVGQMNVPEFQNIPQITFTHFQRSVSLACEDERYMRTKHGGIGIYLAIRLVKIIENSWLKRICRMNDELYTEQVLFLQTKLSELLGTDGVLLLPTWSESACYKYQAIWKAYNVCYDYFVNAFGLASTAVPVGLDGHHMPLSIQVIAAREQDHLCLMIAEELEKLFGGWIPPYNVRDSR